MEASCTKIPMPFILVHTPLGVAEFLSSSPYL